MSQAIKSATDLAGMQNHLADIAPGMELNGVEPVPTPVDQNPFIKTVYKDPL